MLEDILDRLAANRHIATERLLQYVVQPASHFVRQSTPDVLCPLPLPRTIPAASVPRRISAGLGDSLVDATNLSGFIWLLL